jgi:hypothetical protein
MIEMTANLLVLKDLAAAPLIADVRVLLGYMNRV